MASKNENKRADKTLSYLLSATDEVIGAIQQFSNRFTNQGAMFSIKDAIGKEAEVSIPIPSGGTGEVLVTLGHALHNYPARSTQSAQSIERGKRVRISQLANQTLLVEPYAD